MINNLLISIISTLATVQEKWTFFSTLQIIQLTAVINALRQQQIYIIISSAQIFLISNLQRK